MLVKNDGRYVEISVRAKDELPNVIRAIRTNPDGSKDERFYEDRKTADSLVAKLAPAPSLALAQEALRDAATDLLADVRRRYPGEELRCPHMIALDAALTALPGAPAPAAVADEARIRAEEAEGCRQVLREMARAADMVGNTAAAGDLGRAAERISNRIPTAEAARIEARDEVIEAAKAIDKLWNSPLGEGDWHDDPAFELVDNLVQAYRRLTAPGAGGK